MIRWHRCGSVLLAAAAVALCAGSAGRAVAGESANGLAHPEKWPQTRSRGLIDAKTEAFVSQLLAQMSLEEKVGQMIQGDISSVKPEDLRRYPLGSILAGGNSPPLGSDDRSAAAAWIETARAFRTVSMQARPGHTPIPVIFGIDAVHGNSNVVGATIFPHNIGLGAARDPELIRRIGRATAAEVVAAGIDWAFAPTLAVPQDDRWGRAYEGYAEAPDVVRQYAAAMVRGLQGEPGAGSLLQQGLVAASAKHFLGDGGTAGGLDQGDAQSSEDELIRSHAAGYPAAIDAGVMTIMASFSSWQGVKMHGNRSLLTDVLKRRLGFDGFVVGDWNAHGQVPGCTEESCANAVLAGIDMLMAPASWQGLYESTLAQARSGQIPPERIDDAVRRILRIKAQLGLFDPARPWEGRTGVIGASEHRELAREAVRKSLVLLKNEHSVLPIKGTARVLVTGAGADDIGQQCGGWTLSWQGTGNLRKHFPNAQSIYEGLRDALAGSGGSAALSTDGRYDVKPDVAVVVFGETPYAEMQGDLLTLEYQAGDKQDLALLRRLQAEGIAVVSVFLSGRPLWTNPEINASDAFVAAWLPGSEGGGIADVLIADAGGRPRRDFTGKLSFSWPKSAAQTRLNVGQPKYEPLFAYGYGLSYQHPGSVPVLSEESGVSAAQWNVDKYFVGGRTRPPWSFSLAPERDVVSMRSVDAGGVQEAGRQFTWNGTGEGAAVVVGAMPINLVRQTNADLLLEMEYRVDEKPASRVQLTMSCGAACAGTLDLTPILSAAPLAQWQTLKVRLSDFRKAGADMSKIAQPFAVTTAGPLALSLKSLRLGSEPAGAVKLAPVQP
ncbi:MAG TPA: exo 1,3/1,4-beta-D-glucan glucohydrolase [Steroidobacteraceae bacterium]|jgi:beta-glucosidase|nr:exo 1,3/1,4-beta-D-glucan glucohydrolase [Steroidobacteraceae bacterium]